MAWGFLQTDGKSLTVGHGCWKFYANTGELQVTITSGGGGAGSDIGYARFFLLMGA